MTNLFIIVGTEAMSMLENKETGWVQHNMLKWRKSCSIKSHNVKNINDTEICSKCVKLKSTGYKPLAITWKYFLKSIE